LARRDRRNGGDDGPRCLSSCASTGLTVARLDLPGSRLRLPTARLDACPVAQSPAERGNPAVARQPAR
jgi:hypothetical protein